MGTPRGGAIYKSSSSSRLHVSSCETNPNSRNMAAPGVHRASLRPDNSYKHGKRHPRGTRYTHYVTETLWKIVAYSRLGFRQAHVSVVNMTSLFRKQTKCLTTLYGSNTVKNKKKNISLCETQYRCRSLRIRRDVDYIIQIK